MEPPVYQQQQKAATSQMMKEKAVLQTQEIGFTWQKAEPGLQLGPSDRAGGWSEGKVIVPSASVLQSLT